MLAEAAVEQDTAVLPPQYQTNYREEYQYSGLHPGPYVPGFRAVTSCCMLATPFCVPGLHSTAMQCNAAWCYCHCYTAVHLQGHQSRTDFMTECMSWVCTAEQELAYMENTLCQNCIPVIFLLENLAR